MTASISWFLSCTFAGAIVAAVSVVPPPTDCTYWGCKPQFGAGPYDPMGGSTSCNDDPLTEVLVLSRTNGQCLCEQRHDGVEGLDCNEHSPDCTMSISLVIVRGDTPGGHPESYCIREPGMPDKCVDWGFWMGATQRSDPVSATVAGCGEVESATISNSLQGCAGNQCAPTSFCTTRIVARCRTCGYSCYDWHPPQDR